MALPDLTSHHVNYLIWRYLQESGLGEAAVMLQRAWNEDPQSLPFAPYIKAHALVSLVQKGLHYHELEHSIDKEGNAKAVTSADYFFGPLETQKTAAEKSTDQPVSPPAAINGTELRSHGIIVPVRDEIEKSPSPEDVDVDGDVSMGIRADETHDQEPEAPEAPEATHPTLVTGQSVGVQISPAKAADLSPDTAILHVAATDHVTRTLWRPWDPTVVVVAGDSFCSIWKLSSSSAPVEIKLVENEDESLVSAVSWDPTGQKLAIATYNDLCGTVSVYNVDGYALDLLPEMPMMLTGLHWTPSGSHLVIVASNSKTTELVLWDPYSEFVPPQVIDGNIYDLSWSGNNQAYASGDGSVYQCDIEPGMIRVSKEFPSDSPNTIWTYIRCTNAGNSSVAVAASSGTASLWIPTHDMRLDDAHNGDITAIDLHASLQPWSPLQKNQKIVLTSFSTDSTVKIWNIDLEAKRFDCVHSLSLGSSIPALAGGLSPDGYALAASSKNKLLIWNTERGGNALATWIMPGSEEVKAEEGPDRAVNGQNGTTDFPDRSLSWDTDGKKLAIGFGQEIAIVNMQR